MRKFFVTLMVFGFVALHVNANDDFEAPAEQWESSDIDKEPASDGSAEGMYTEDSSAVEAPQPQIDYAPVDNENVESSDDSVY